MSGLGKNIQDTLKNQGGPRSELFVDGVKRGEVRPAGVQERFVDLVGTVVSVQLAKGGDADPANVSTLMRKRHHDLGFIEHGKCPLKSGARYASPKLTAFFIDLPQSLQVPCVDDPKCRVKTDRGIEVRDPCPHIKWHMDRRIAERAIDNEHRNSSRVEADRLKADQAELLRLQLDAVKESLIASRAKSTAPVDDKAAGKAK